MPAKLTITNSETNRTFDFELARDESRIGRAADRNEIVLDDGQVSRQHAVIRRNGGSLVLVDLNSANGTFIDGERIHEHTLRHADAFAIGKYRFKYKDQTAGLSIKYDNRKIGNTVLMRTPGQMASIIPQIDRN